MQKGSIFGVLSALLLLCNCSKEASHEPNPLKPVLTQQYRKQSITAIVSLSNTNITTTGQVLLMLEVHAPPETEVLFPEIGPLIEPFTISDSYSEPLQTLPNGKTLHRKIWTLIPALPGEVTVPPLEIIAGTASIQTAPFTLSVQSILPDGLEGLEIKDIAAPISLLPKQRRQHRLWLILAIATCVAGAGIGIRHRIKKNQLPSLIPPHEVALKALNSLHAETANTIQRVHELNRILRRYINDRFKIPALESTCSELEKQLDHKELIQFLRDCDDIKFSHSTTAGFTEHAENFIRSYIENTREEEPCD